jgi:hypothetical protein
MCNGLGIQQKRGKERNFSQMEAIQTELLSAKMKGKKKEIQLYFGDNTKRRR